MTMGTQGIYRCGGPLVRSAGGLEAALGPQLMVYRWSEMHCENFRLTKLEINSEGPLRLHMLLGIHRDTEAQ